MVSGISPERALAVIVPPVVMPQTRQTSAIETELRPVPAYTAAEWQQHPNPFDRKAQEFYDMHGKLIPNNGPTGTQLDKHI